MRTEIAYFGYLRSDRGVSRGMPWCHLDLTIPRTIADQYGQRPPEYLHSVRAMPHARASYRVVVCPDHGSELIDVTLDKERQWPRSQELPGAPVFEFEDKKPTKGDFNLLIRSEPEVGSALIETIQRHGPEGYQADTYAMMINVPAALTLQTEDRSSESEIIFLADRSGSMEDKIGALKSAMNFFLKGVLNGRDFNLWCFGSDCEYLWAQSQKYDQTSLEAAEK